MGSVAVEVDRPSILAEAASIAAEAPSDTPAAAAAELAGDPSSSAPTLDPAARAVDMAPVVSLLVLQTAGVFAPAWDVTQDEAASIGGPLAMVLAYFVPDGAVHPKWIALATCAGALWNVASQRRDAEGNWRPLRRKPGPAPAPAPQSTANVASLRV